MRIIVSVLGEKEVIGSLNKLDFVAVAGVKSAVRDTVMGVERGAKLRARVKTGRMRSAIHGRVYNDGLTGEVGVNVDYALPVEKGTGPHLITPKKAKALRFTAGGKTVFAKHVHHPGTKPSPFLYPAWDAEKPQYLSRVNAALNHAVVEAEK